jgi:hypothetical protein
VRLAQRNYAHETCHTPQNQAGRLNIQVSDGLQGFNQLIPNLKNNIVE